MGSSSLSRDRTPAPCIRNSVLTTGPLESPKTILNYSIIMQTQLHAAFDSPWLKAESQTPVKLKTPVKSVLSSVVAKIVVLDGKWQCHDNRPTNSFSFSLQPAFHPADSVRGTRHHGLVERPSRTRFHPLHRRSGDKPGRQISFFIVWGEDKFWNVWKVFRINFSQ